MAIVDRLKDLVLKSGGDITNVHTIEEAVSALENVGGGDSESDIFIIHADTITTQFVTPVLEETSEDVINALKTEKYILLVSRYDGRVYDLESSYIDEYSTASTPDFWTKFQRFEISENVLIHTAVELYPDSNTGELTAGVVVGNYSLTQTT